MAMEPIWENDFHSLSYGFRPERSVHHAIRTVKLLLTDCKVAKGRWVIEGDLSSYFDTIHHILRMKCGRKRISCKQFNNLLWRLPESNSYLRTEIRKTLTSCYSDVEMAVRHN